MSGSKIGPKIGPKKPWGGVKIGRLPKIGYFYPPWWWKRSVQNRALGPKQMAYFASSGPKLLVRLHAPQKKLKARFCFWRQPSVGPLRGPILFGEMH